MWGRASPRRSGSSAGWPKWRPSRRSAASPRRTGEGPKGEVARRAPSTPSSSQHLNPVGGHDADVSGPCSVRRDKNTNWRSEILGSRRMDPNQDDAGSFERNSALYSNLPEVLIQRQHDARFGFGEVQEDSILPPAAIGPSPKYIAAVGAKRIDNRLRKVLVGQETHLRGNRKGLVFVGQVAGVRKAGEDILPRQTGIVSHEFFLGLAGSEEFENELDGQTRTSDHRFTVQELRIHDDAFRQRHDYILTWQCGPTESGASAQLRQRLLAVLHALLDLGHHVGPFRRIVLVLDAAGELVLLLLHELQDLFQGRLPLSPWHVGASGALSAVLGRAARALAVLQVQTRDPVVVLLHQWRRRLAVDAVVVPHIEVQRGVLGRRHHFVKTGCAALAVGVESDLQFALGGVIGHPLEQLVIGGQLHGDVVGAQRLPHVPDVFILGVRHLQGWRTPSMNTSGTW